MHQHIKRRVEKQKIKNAELIIFSNEFLSDDASQTFETFFDKMPSHGFIILILVHCFLKILLVYFGSAEQTPPHSKSVLKKRPFWMAYLRLELTIQWIESTG